jgi:hypothetical protein
MIPLLIPAVALLGFLSGAALGTNRRGLSMLPPEKPSPLPGVPRLAWERFVTVMVVAPKQHVTPRRRFGMFGLDSRRLADVGFMTEPRKTTIGSEVGVWSGTWHPPLDEQKFLASSGAQYEAFSRSMRQLLPAALPHVGRVVDGVPATLSGLLAVGHLAGSEGIAGWSSDPTMRKKFRATTANFEGANGIF